MSMRIPFFSQDFNRIRQVPLFQSHEAAGSGSGQDAFSCKTKRQLRINNCLHHTVFNTQSAVSLLLTPS